MCSAADDPTMHDVTPDRADRSDSGDIDVERLDRAIEAFYGRRLPRTSAEGIAREYARAPTPRTESPDD